MALKIIWNDILKERTDAIVTPASRFPRIGTGLDKFVHQAAGSALLKARETLGNLGPGRVAVSSSFGLRKTTGAKWIIHALGPVCGEQSGIQDELILDGCYLRILCKAVELKCKTVSIPVLSSGKFGMRMETAVRVAVRAIKDFLRGFPQLEVKLVGIDLDFAECARSEYAQYFSGGGLTTTKAEALRKKIGPRAYADKQGLSEAFSSGEVDPYFKDYVLRHASSRMSFGTHCRKIWEEFSRRQKLEAKEHTRNPRRYFITSVGKLSTESGINIKTLNRFCAKTSVVKRTSKDKVFALCAAMRLTPDCSKFLLASSGHRFESTERDELVYSFIERGGGNIGELNELLRRRGFRPLKTTDKS